MPANLLHALLPIERIGIIKAQTSLLRFFLSLIYESDAMLFKKIAIAAAVVTTLAFVGCAKKTQEAAPASAAASEATAASEAITAASEAAPVASEATAAASDAAPVASEAAASEAAH